MNEDFELESKRQETGFYNEENELSNEITIEEIVLLSIKEKELVNDLPF